MAATRVYISASVSTADEESAVRELVTLLRRHGFETLYNANAETFSDWREHAHAAVILLTPRAVESARVQYEIRTLQARAERDKSFRILVVLIEACDVPASLGSLPVIKVLGRPVDWLVKKLVRSIPRQAKPSEARTQFRSRFEGYPRRPGERGHADYDRPPGHPMVSDRRRSPSYKAPSKGSVQHGEERIPTEQTEAPRRTEHLQFTAFHPKEVKPQNWYTLLVYTHIPSALDTVYDDAPKFNAEMGDAPRETSQAAVQPVTRGNTITIVPRMPGVSFNPDRLKVQWTEDWQRAYFRFQVDEEPVDPAINGEIACFAGPLLVATLKIGMLIERTRPLRMMAHMKTVDHTGPATRVSRAPATRDARTASVTSVAYQRIFASYSHRDMSIVTLCRDAYRGLGNTVYIDFESLKPGQRFSPALFRLIDRSDIFQLFWSKSASTSRYVREEWQYALTHTKGEGFIRPVYWRLPMFPPPPELADLHFMYMPLSSMSPE